MEAAERSFRPLFGARSCPIMAELRALSTTELERCGLSVQQAVDTLVELNRTLQAAPDTADPPQVRGRRRR